MGRTMTGFTNLLDISTLVLYREISFYCSHSLRCLLRIGLDPDRLISYLANFTQNFETVNMMKSTDGLYVLRPPIEFMLERSIDGGNLKSIRNWKDTYSGVKNWGSNQRISCHYTPSFKGCDMEKKSTRRLRRSLPLEMLHGGRKLQRHHFKKKPRAFLTLSVKSNLVFHTSTHRGLLEPQVGQNLSHA